MTSRRRSWRKLSQLLCFRNSCKICALRLYHLQKSNLQLSACKMYHRQTVAPTVVSVLHSSGQQTAPTHYQIIALWGKSYLWYCSVRTLGSSIHCQYGSPPVKGHIAQRRHCALHMDPQTTFRPSCSCFALLESVSLGSGFDFPHHIPSLFLWC